MHSRARALGALTARTAAAPRRRAMCGTVMRLPSRRGWLAQYYSNTVMMRHCLHRDPASTQNIAAMHRSQPYIPQSPKKKLVPRTETYKARAAARTTQTGDATPAQSNNDNALDWAEFLEHSRFDHDVANCSFCTSNRLDTATAAPIASPAAARDVQSFRQQTVAYVSEAWSRHRLVLANLLRTHRAVSRALLLSVKRRGKERRVVADCPPVLPQLRPFSPLFRDADWWAWRSIG
ncbi:hypothetical protein OPT61_g6155 [Boeremia exigua]|uniref:Uncharacterized protein n=1 Tax=Boeremia exigua TaxID=749465 RepID=A0ACC2I7T1_9PLEO|nr:hypothetical protein OPT61_g6155 [Boeremia exigua]